MYRMQMKGVQIHIFTIHWKLNCGQKSNVRGKNEVLGKDKLQTCAN